MVKNLKILIYSTIVLFISFLLSGCDTKKVSENAEQNQNDVNISRMSTSKDSNNSDFNNQNIDNTTRNNSSISNDNSEKKAKEIELSSFSTPLTSGVANRIINIKLTCGKLNEKILRNGESFSFNQIVGPCTAEEGYKEAEIYVNKQIKYALGGGNCQVSTTLYNALIAVPGITVTERHEHGMPVDYIEDGKDATISYNTLDLKFENHTGSEIKIYASCDDVNVYAKIVKIVYE